MLSVTLTLPISEECLCDILTTAFEGGINYWVKSWEVTHKPSQKPECSYMAPAYGGTVELLIPEYYGTYQPLTQQNLLAALGRAASEGRFAWGEDMAGDIDAEIADVIMQYACLGEIFFG